MRQRGEAIRFEMDKNWKDYILRALANLCVAKILMENINGRFKELKVNHQQVTRRIIPMQKYLVLQFHDKC